MSILAKLRRRNASTGDETARTRRPAARWGIRAARTLVALFAVIGVLATGNLLFGAPGVGHFRSAEGRAEYLAAYDEAMAELPEPTQVHDIPTDFGTIRVYDWEPEENADQAPFLLMPGRSSGVPMWEENLPGLLEGRRVLALDTLGDAGLSQQTVPFASFADQTTAIDQVVQELAPAGVHAVGHSFGGALALSYALDHPERTLSLALLEPAFALAYPPADMLGWTVLASLPGLPEGLRDRALQKVGGEEASVGDDPLSRMIAAASEHYAADLPQPTPASPEDLRQLEVPTYVAIAADHSLAGGEAAVEHGEEIPGATVEVWPDTTHSLPMQAAGDIEPVLRDHAAAHDGP